MGHGLRPRWLAAVAVLVVAVACAAPPPGHGDRAVHYDSVGELVAAADAVVVGRVAETGRGGVLDEEDAVLLLEVVADYTRLALCKAQVAQVAGERQGRNILD
ncbi:MAG TPA: hypothetical protein VGU26_00050 [Gaiellaceae bacterium]|nr:hypothetical protein [Gaiellaceae bacterium]